MAIQSVTQSEALSRAMGGQSLGNFPAILEGFAAKGIPEDQIQPRVNVFTYNAWKALGRQVRRGEHGVKVFTFVAMTKKNGDGEAESIGTRPRMTTVFHISQTDPVQ